MARPLQGQYQGKVYHITSGKRTVALKILSFFTAIISLLIFTFVQEARTEGLSCQLTPAQTKKFASQAKQSVVDYYQVMRSCPELEVVYSLRFIDGQWVIGDKEVDEEPDEYIVDIKNGFIQVGKEFGDGYSTLQIALFRNADGEAIIGYYREQQVGAYFGFQDVDLSFYKLNEAHTQLIEVTKEVLPAITLADFGLPDVEYKKLKTIEDEAYRSADELNILFSYELPRCGTILKVKLVANKYSLSFYRTFKREPSEVEILNHYESLIKTESINFKWDKTHSRFVLQYL